MYIVSRRLPTINLALALTVFAATLHFLSTPSALAQAPAGTIEGCVTDGNGLSITTAHITLEGRATGVHGELQDEPNGQFRFSALPVGDYALTIETAGFATMVESAIHISVGDATRIDAKLKTATLNESIVVQAAVQGVDLATNSLGKTVTQREIVDLPLNGRNFAQLGLLQTGVAPLTNGLLTEGGSLRTGQSYVVNGQRPEANNFLLDGAQNVDRMDGGFAHSDYKGFGPRVGFAWDPLGTAKTSIRAAYGIFYDAFSNGSNVTAQAPISSLPGAQFVEISGRVNFQAPHTGRTVPAPNTFTQTATAFTMDPRSIPSDAQDWNLGVQQELGKAFVLEARYVGTKGIHLPRTSRPTPPSSAPERPPPTQTTAASTPTAVRTTAHATSRLLAS